MYPEWQQWTCHWWTVKNRHSWTVAHWLWAWSWCWKGGFFLRTSLRRKSRCGGCTLQSSNYSAACFAVKPLWCTVGFVVALVEKVWVLYVDVLSCSFFLHVRIETLILVYSLQSYAWSRLEIGHLAMDCQKRKIFQRIVESALNYCQNCYEYYWLHAELVQYGLTGGSLVICFCVQILFVYIYVLCLVGHTAKALRHNYLRKQTLYLVSRRSPHCMNFGIIVLFSILFVHLPQGFVFIY